MSWQLYSRKSICIVIAFILIYFIVFRRRSTRFYLTEAEIDKYFQQKSFNMTYPRRIPRIIHQTWRTHDVPRKWNHTVQSVRVFNANDFEYHIWTDEDINRYVRHVQPAYYEKIFLNYPLDIQRIDAFRYIVLYYIGGIYIDMDNGCRKSFETLIETLESLDSKSQHLAAFPRTSPIGISNGFMISTKGHPLFQMLIAYLPTFAHNYLIDYLTVMLSAGPIFLSIIEFYFDQISTSSSVRILDEIVYSGIYTWHTPGNSWHGKDARMILSVYHSIRLMPTKYLLFFVLFVLVVFFRRRLFSRFQRRRCRSLNI